MNVKALDPEAFEPHYVSMFAESFPETAGTSLQTPEHYRWKYGPGGKGAPVCEYGSYEETELRGFYAALPFRFRIEGQDCIGGAVCDVMTRPTSRGKSVFVELGRYALADMSSRGVDFVIGFVIRPLVMPGHRKAGWRVAFPLPVYLRVLDPTQVLAARGLGWLTRPARAIIRLYGSVATWSQPRFGVRVAKQDPGFFDSADYAAFHEAWSASSLNSMTRAPAFWAWRLCPPAIPYTVWTARENGAVAAIAVTRRMKIQEFDVLAVADVLCREECRSLPALYGALAAEARQIGAAAVAFMCTEAMAARLRLVRNGFFKSPVVFQLILKWLAPRPEPATFWDMPSWHLTWLDTDTV